MEGTIILVQDHVPTKVNYQIGCDAHWLTEFLHLRQERNGEETRLAFEVTKERSWSSNGSRVSFAEGLSDLDLEMYTSPLTPFR